MTNEADQLVAQIATGADHHAARQLGNELSGLLWQHQQASSDPDEQAALRAERAAVRAQSRELAPDSPRVADSLRAWGARIRDLRA